MAEVFGKTNLPFMILLHKTLGTGLIDSSASLAVSLWAQVPPGCPTGDQANGSLTICSHIPSKECTSSVYSSCSQPLTVQVTGFSLPPVICQREQFTLCLSYWEHFFGSVCVSVEPISWRMFGLIAFYEGNGARAHIPNKILSRLLPYALEAASSPFFLWFPSIRLFQTL